MTLRRLLILGLMLVLLTGCGQSELDDAQSAALSIPIQSTQSPALFLDSLALSDSVSTSDAEGHTTVFGTLDSAGLQQVDAYWSSVLAADDSAEVRDATISSSLEIKLEDQTVSMTLISDLPAYLEAHGIPTDGFSRQNFSYCIEKT